MGVVVDGVDDWARVCKAKENSRVRRIVTTGCLIGDIIVYTTLVI